MQLLDVFDPRGAMRPDAAMITFATMCWPNRNEAEERAALLAFKRFDARQRGLTNHVATEDQFALGEAHRRGWNILKSANKRKTLGWRAGHVALELVRLITVDPKNASLIEACRLSASVPVNDPKSAKRLNAQKLAERACGKLLPALPLWGAAYFAEHEDPWSHNWMSDHGALVRMLRVAQAWRERFETFAPRSGRNAGKPILPPGAAWQPPLYFTERVDVFVPQLAEHERAAIADQRQLTDQRSA